MILIALSPVLTMDDVYFNLLLHPCNLHLNIVRYFVNVNFQFWRLICCYNIWLGILC